jgi:hypothetical protein
MASRGLFQVENPYSRATTTMAQASGSMGLQRPDSKTETEVEKTAGGGIAAGATGAASGAMIGTALAGSGTTAAGAAAGGAASGSYAGWWGAAIGAVIGLLAYYLS